MLSFFNFDMCGIIVFLAESMTIWFSLDSRMYFRLKLVKFNGQPFFQFVRFARYKEARIISVSMALIDVLHYNEE